MSLRQVTKFTGKKTRHLHYPTHKRWIGCPVVRVCVAGAWQRSKFRLATNAFLGMAQPAKPLIALHAGTNDPMPKRQILRSCGRMWKRRRRIAFETCHITLSPNTVPFRFRKLVCFTSVRPCHKPSQTPFFHGSLVPRLFHIDSKSGFKA